MANVKISELAVNSSPSASATLAGVDGGETVQIPISKFVTKDEGGNVTVTGKATVKDGMDVLGESIFRNDIIMQGGGIDVTNAMEIRLWNETDSKNSVLYCSDDGELLLDGKPVATKDDIPDTSNFVTKDENGDVTVETLQVNNDIRCVSTLEMKEGYMARFWSDDNSKKVSLRCDDNGKLSLDGKEVATVDDIPSGGSIGDHIEVSSIGGVDYIEFDNQLGDIRGNEDGLEVMSQYELQLQGTLGIEVESTGHIAITSSTEGISINSKNTTIDGVSSIKTLNEDAGQPGQVLTTNGETVYWGNASGGGSPMTSITYAELRALRDAGNLIPGMFYRITDYECTTAQENTRAMNHRFYIIVQALSHDTLSETAKADLVTDGTDDYFVDEGANVSAWEIKYCLDNDTTRFAWACDTSRIYTDDEFWFTNTGTLEYEGTTYYKWTAGNTDDTVLSTTLDINVGDSLHYIVCPSDGEPYGFELDYSVVLEKQGGKGVIYYMKDEHGNECPYDFKNIQFKRMVSLENGYPTLDEENGEETWVYTFCGNSYHIDNDEWSELKDGSLENPYGHQSDEYTSTFHNNVIGEYRILYDGENEDYTKCGKLHLSNNVFFGYWEEIGSTDPENYPYYYAYGCMNNKLGNNCYNNTFDYGCNNNTFSYGCYNNTFGNYCSDNTFGDDCWGNTFWGYCKLNTFDGNCTNNTFGDGCEGNTFGHGCYNNTFDHSCSDNTFGVWCYSNTFGNICTNNTFGNVCWGNTFGEGCNNNYLALQCRNSEINGSGNFVAYSLNGDTINKSDSFITSV